MLTTHANNTCEQCVNLCCDSSMFTSTCESCVSIQCSPVHANNTCSIQCSPIHVHHLVTYHAKIYLLLLRADHEEAITHDVHLIFDILDTSDVHLEVSQIVVTYINTIIVVHQYNRCVINTILTIEFSITR